MTAHVAGGWFLAVPWHHEETADTDPAPQRVFAALVEAAAGRKQALRQRSGAS